MVMMMCSGEIVDDFLWGGIVHVSGVVGDRRMLPGSVLKRLYVIWCTHSLVALKCVVVTVDW